MADQGCGGERSGFHSRFAFFHAPIFFHRVILLMCAMAISAAVMYNSRPGRENSTPAVFSVPSSSRGYVRISGDVRHAGIYPLSVNTMTMTAIKMADPLSATMDGLAEADAAAYLDNGMALHVTVRPNGTLMLTKSQMAANERLVMGVPLDINAMNEADFDRVPGIGPIMAKRITEHRQNNGGTMAVADLLSVEGIGEKKYNHLLKYF
ncbi:MAG: helix-hairpin-helix domain-containing protein [Verrucomicrobia bacterium]|nr:helix-hairpin-helix domain-containing protein [Deltaproteobacteria bacterium]